MFISKFWACRCLLYCSVNIYLKLFIIKMEKLFPVLYKVLSAGKKFMVETFPIEHFPKPLLQSNSYSFTSCSMIWAIDIFSVLHAVQIKTSLENFTILIFHDMDFKLKSVNGPCKHSFNMYAFLFAAPMGSKQTIASKSVLDRDSGTTRTCSFPTTKGTKAIRSPGVVLRQQWPEL